MKIMQPVFYIFLSMIVTACCQTPDCEFPPANFETSMPVCDPPPGTPANSPLGIARGPVLGRVAWIHRPQVSTWNGTDGYYWEEQNVNQTLLDSMLREIVASVAGTHSAKDGWDALFRYFNNRSRGQDVGYTPGEKIAVKLNLNMHYSTRKVNSNSISPQTIKSFLRSLVQDGEVHQEDIFLYDASRYWPDYFLEPPVGFRDEFPAVHLVDTSGNCVGNCEKALPDPDTGLHFSDSRVTDHDNTMFPSILTAATYHMNFACLRGHTYAGITAFFKNYFGSIWRENYTCPVSTSWCPGAPIHDFICSTNPPCARPMATYDVLVDLAGSRHTSGKLVLAVVDGLYGGLSQGNGSLDTSCPPIKWLSAPFSNWWTASLFASADPVGLDSVLFDLCRNEPLLASTAGSGCVDNYLHEAALAHDPPSGTFYDPNGSGSRLESLGVHEHWNNPQEKKYSRNLKTGNGIELVTL